MAHYKMLDGELVKITKAEADAMAVASPELQLFTYKADIWRRATDEEAVTLDAALKAAPLRLQRLFDGATRLVHDDPDFGSLKVGIAQAVGQARADELLAPSEA